MNVYTEILLDHGQNPRNVGKLARATHTASEINIACGDVGQVELRVVKHTIVEIKHQTRGCLVAVSTASILSEKLIGQTSVQVLKIDTAGLLKILGVELTASRLKCAWLPLRAIQKALSKT